VGRGAPGRAGSGAQLRDRRRNSAPYRQTELANSRQCAEGAEPRPEYEDQGGGYPQIAGTGCGMAAAVASAADHRRGHRARPDRRGADVRRCLRLDLGRGWPAPHHARTAREGARAAAPPRRSPRSCAARVGQAPCAGAAPSAPRSSRRTGPGGRSGAAGAGRQARPGRINNDYEERAACRLRLERELTSGCGAWAGCVAVVAAFTRASSSRASSPSSGFHCTPRPHRWPCTSSASTT
jgi:hypothetical protein